MDDMLVGVGRKPAWWLAAVLVGFYYFLLVTHGTFDLTGDETHGMVFNSALSHLLHGDLGIDSAAIGYEAFVKDGRTLTYFGIFPSLIRLVVMPFIDLTKVEVSRLSCYVGLVICLFFQIQILCCAYRNRQGDTALARLFLVICIATVFSGPALYLTATSYAYNEPVIWGMALATIFNFAVFEISYGVSRTAPRMVVLATTAGLALLTRPSTGMALYLGGGGILAFVLMASWSEGFQVMATPPSTDRNPRSAVAWLILAATIFVTLGGVAAAINYFKWGSIFKFVDFNYYQGYISHPEVATQIKNYGNVKKYGELNVYRIIPSLQYYFIGFKPFHAPLVHLMGTGYDGFEGPQSSFFLTWPLTIFLAMIGSWSAFHTRTLAPVIIAASGQVIALLVVLSAMYLALRYRGDFLPLFSLLSAVGVHRLSNSWTEIAPRRRKHIVRAVIVLAIAQIFFSHVLLLAYSSYLRPLPWLSSFVPAWLRGEIGLWLKPIL